MRKHFLVLTTLLSLGWGFSAIAAVGDKFQSGDLEYEITSQNEVTVNGFTNGYQNTTTNLVIPETVSDKGATYSVTSVGIRAFQYQSALVEVTFPNSLKTLQYGAFYNIPTLTKINWGTGLKSLGDNALGYCGFTSLDLPEGLESIGESCFFLCKNLVSINFPSSLQTIGTSAFYKVPLTEVTLPEGLTTLGAKAFLSCSQLKKVNLNKNLTSIGDGTFYECKSLTSIQLPESVKSIGDEAFWETALSEFHIPANLESIGGAAFARTNISKFTIDPQNPYFKIDSNGILYNADQSLLVASPPKSNITQLTLPASCLGISYGAFYGSSIQKVTVGDKFRAFDGYAFVLSSLSEINFPKSCVFIGEQAFAGTNLTNVVLPPALPEIQMGAFAECKALNSVTIPASVNYIDNRAFLECTSLVTVNCLGMTPPDLEIWYESYEDPFFNIPSNAVLNVPVGTADAYKKSLWNDCFTNIKETLPASLQYTAVTPEIGASISSFDGLTLSFGEEVSIANSDPEISVIAGQLVAGVPVGDAVSVDMWGASLENGKTEVRFYPEDYDYFVAPFNMEEGKSYFVIIPAGVVKNAAGSLNEEIIIQYEGAYVKPTVKLQSTTPADNANIEQINTIEFTFADAVSIVTSKLEDIKVIKGSLVDGVPTGTNVLNGAFWGVYGQTSGTTVAVFAGDEYDGYAEPINLELGSDYYVVLPAGLFRLNSSYTTTSPEYVLHYSNPAPEIKLTSVDPKNDSRLEEINTLSFTFAESVSIVDEKLEEIQVVKGSLVDGVPTGTNVLEGVFWGVYGKTTGTTVEIFSGDEYDGYAMPVYLEAGSDYYVVLPAGLFSLDSHKATTTDQIILHYSGPAAALNLVSSNPADGAEISELTTVEFTFEESVDINTSMLEDVKLYKDEIGGSELSFGAWWPVYDKTSGTTVAIFAGDEYDGFSQPVELEGKSSYYLVLPAGLFTLSSDSSVKSEEIILGYIGLETSGIGLSVTEDKDIEIYTLQGIRVNSTTPGNIYIIRKGNKSSRVLIK